MISSETSVRQIRPTLPWKSSAWFLTWIRLWRRKRHMIGQKSCHVPRRAIVSNSNLIAIISCPRAPHTLTTQRMTTSLSRIATCWTQSCPSTSSTPAHGLPWRASSLSTSTYSSHLRADWLCRRACFYSLRWRRSRSSWTESGWTTAPGLVWIIAHTSIFRWLRFQSSLSATLSSLPSSTS